MGQTAPISLDRFRRRPRAQAPQPVHAPAIDTHPLVGLEIGSLERRYGLMTSRERVSITEVVATSGDLAVADRLAFLDASRRHEPVLVVEFDGWYVTCVCDRTLDVDDYAQLVAPVDPARAARMMSVATERGIMPMLGALTGA